MDTAMAMAGTLLITLAQLVEHARRTRVWVVVVTAGANASQMVLLLPGIVPPESYVAGRTAAMPGGGRLTIAEPSTEMEDHAYHVAFVGLDALSAADEVALHGWRARAAEIVELER